MYDPSVRRSSAPDMRHVEQLRLGMTNMMRRRRDTINSTAHVFHRIALIVPIDTKCLIS